MSDYDPIGEFRGASRTILFCAGAVATMLVLLACSDARPVAYYAGHPQDRAQRIEACLAKGSETADCQNAKQAEFDARGIAAVHGRAVQSAR